MSEIKPGDEVTELDQPDVGVVRAIHPGAFVVVKWKSNGWISVLPLALVRKIENKET